MLLIIIVITFYYYYHYNYYYIKKKLCFRNLKEQLYEKHLFKKRLSNVQLYKKFFFALHSASILNLSLNELKQISKMGRIKGYKNMSKERLLNALDESESAKSLNSAKIENIKEDFNKSRDRFLKPKIKEIRKNLMK